MLSIIAGALFVVLLPVLVASLVWRASDAARRAGVRIPRIMRAGPWR